MDFKKVLIPFVAVLAVMILGFAAADELGDLTYDIQTEFNGVDLGYYWYNSPDAGFAGDTIPVRVTFTAVKNAEDVKIKVWLEGYRNDIKAETGRFNIIENVRYSKLLSLTLPSDTKDVSKDYTLHVSVSNADGYDFREYELSLQRESYKLGVLSADFNSEVSAGDTVPVSVVIENTGFQRADNNYIIVSIPSLGVSSKAYLGDLIPTEDCMKTIKQNGCEVVIEDCDNEEDAVSRTLYIQIPESAAEGVYEMDIQVYNKDATTTLSKLIRVSSSDLTQVLAAVKNQDIKSGETKTYELILVNSGKNVKVFNLNAVSGSALDVSVPSVVTVGPDSSQTVPVTVTASKGADIGAYTFTVNADSKQVVFGANVIGSKTSTSVVALTVILVIIFVVLLVVLIVLLTRKEKPIEEAETSYY